VPVEGGNTVRKHQSWRALVRSGILTTVCAVAAQSSAWSQNNTEPQQEPAAGAGDSSQTKDSLAAKDSLEEVVVTGFRRSLELAIDVKRQEVNPVDAIMAEDIADFPDLNLAEAIQRIPGVTINRESGQGRTITVRGLGGDFTRTMINGMETMAATTGNRGRGFDFNVFASELFQSITVRKTQSADLDEGSLGATVQLQTARPFDFTGFRAALAGQGSYNDVTKDTNPRFAGLVSWANENKTFGGLLSAAYSKRNPFDEGFGTTRWANHGTTSSGNFGSCPACATAQDVNAVNDSFHPRIPRYAESLVDQERYGLTSSLQWAPTDQTLINFDALYAYYKSQTENANAGSISFSRTTATGIQETDVMDYEIDANNNMVYGVFNDVDLRSENGFERHITKYNQFTLSGKHEFNDKLRLDALIGTSKNDLQTPYNFSFAYDLNNVDGYAYDFRDDARLPFLVHGADMTSGSAWTLTEARRRESSIINKYDTGSIKLAFDLREGLTLKGGVLAKQFDANFLDFSSGGALSGIAPDRILTGVDSIARVLGIGRRLDIPDGSDRAYLVPDVFPAADYVGLFTDPRFALRRADGDSRDVGEKDYSGFLAAEFQTELAGMRLRGNAGVRYAKTKTESTGYLAGVASTSTFVSVENTYNDTLPSLNLALEPVQDTMIRAGIAKVMARPALGNLTPGGSVNTIAQTISYGNPLLEPFRATNYDLAVEWYFAPESLVGLAVFYKDVESFIVRQTETVPYNQTGLPLELFSGDPNTPFEVSRNINGEGGWIQGVEFQYQQPFTFLPGFLKNFGFIGNYTYVESRVSYGDDGYNNLLNLSPNTYNLTLYYEAAKFRARVSAAYRDRYLTAFPGGNGNTEEGVNQATNIDASMSYAITDQATFTLEGINLTDEFTDAYVDTTNRVSRYRHTGREVLFGLRYTF
jgi:iron complex outermembrane recepter protein